MAEKIYDYYGASGVIDKVEAYHVRRQLTLLIAREMARNTPDRSKPWHCLATGKILE